MNRSLSTRRPAAAAAVGIALAVLLSATVAGAGTNAGNVTHATLVSTNPVDNTPAVLDGQVYAIVDLGSRVLVGGSFTQVKKWSNPTVFDRNGLFAYDKATGNIDPTFNPGLGNVRAMVLSPDGVGVIVAGRFNYDPNGAYVGGITKLDPTTGAVVSRFRTATNGFVSALALSGRRLFLGGSFSKIKAVARANLGAIDAITGTVDLSVNVPVAVPTRGTVQVWRMSLSPDGRRLVVIGDFQQVGGASRTQVAVIDVGSNPARTTAWQTNWFAYGNCSTSYDFVVKDVDIDPTGTYFVVVTTGAWGNGTAGTCDSVTRWELANDSAGQDPTWREYSGGDSYSAVAITGPAIYVAGHTRWQNNASAPRGDTKGVGAVDRAGIAALDPASGLPLSWTIQRERGIEVGTLTVTAAGLYIGSDSSKIGNEWHPRLAFLPVAGGTTPATVTPRALPATIVGIRADGTRVQRSFDGTFVGPAQEVPDDGTGWGTVRGTMAASDRSYRLRSDGTFQSSTDGFSWTGVPSWSDGTGAFTRLTGAAYLGGKLYYTVSGGSGLYARGFTADGPLLGTLVYTAGSGNQVDFGHTRGLLAVGGQLYQADTSGRLNRIEISTATGEPKVVGATQVSGPGIDGVDWSDVVGLAAG
ncbi:MAG: hypothetical protein HYX34_15380 [Actinobacteria bacterium]|nr:hypothetical protein [Actinomycetota bacterium]